MPIANSWSNWYKVEQEIAICKLESSTWFRTAPTNPGSAACYGNYLNSPCCTNKNMAETTIVFAPLLAWISAVLAGKKCSERRMSLDINQLRTLSVKERHIHHIFMAAYKKKHSLSLSVTHWHCNHLLRLQPSCPANLGCSHTAAPTEGLDHFQGR